MFNTSTTDKGAKCSFIVFKHTEAFLCNNTEVIIIFVYQKYARAISQDKVILLEGE